MDGSMPEHGDSGILQDTKQAKKTSELELMRACGEADARGNRWNHIGRHQQGGVRL